LSRHRPEHRPARALARAGMATAASAVLVFSAAFAPAQADVGAPAGVPASAGVPAAAGVPASAEPQDDEQVTDLGVAMQSINVRLSAVGELADGTPVGYLFSDGEPVSLDVVDLQTGELLDHHQIAPYTVASSIAVAGDGTVYLSVRSPNDGTLWSYSPASGELEEVATGIAGEEMLRTLDVDGDTLFGTTYPNANAYAVDLDTEEVTEYGRIAPEGDYAWGLEAQDGQLWVGAGTPAQLFDVDPADGSTEAIELPEAVANSGEFIQRIETYDDLTVVSHREVDGVSAHVRDGSDWVDALDIAGMWHYTQDMADGAFYYLDGDSALWSYDVAAREATAVDLSESGIEDELTGTSQMFLAELDTAEFPGASVVGVRPDGQIWRYNLATGNGDVLATDTAGAPVTTMSMAPGGDGQIYLGAYLSSGVMARIDPNSNEITQLDGPEQADAITAHGDQTFIGTYPNAEVYRGQAGHDWEWGTNPEHVLTLGRAETGQDRPRHMISAGDHVAIATIPNYGELGGGLTLLDPQSGDYEFNRDIVADQSVTDLAYADGVVYAGTSIHGGLDSTPVAQTAELFAWDVQDGLIASTQVVDGAEVIHSLAMDGAGSLWAMADTGELIEYDVSEHEVVRTIDTQISHGNQWGSTSALDLNPADGLLYGSAGGQLFSFDPVTEELQTLVESGVRLSTVADGDVFFADQTNAYRFHLETAPVCDEEITGSHRGPIQVSEGTTCITGAEIRGPVTVTEAASVTISDSQVRGPIRADDADRVQLTDNEITGPVQIHASTGAVQLRDNDITGTLSCSGNASDPEGEGNSVRGPASGQCADLQ